MCLERLKRTYYIPKQNKTGRHKFAYVLAKRVESPFNYNSK